VCAKMAAEKLVLSPPDFLKFRCACRAARRFA
jgi:hypothetical protein